MSLPGFLSEDEHLAKKHKSLPSDSPAKKEAQGESKRARGTNKYQQKQPSRKKKAGRRAASPAP
jgi:hypothetical protein